MAKQKPTADEMLKRAQAMLKKASAAKKEEERAKLVRLGQLLTDCLNEKITVEQMLTEANEVARLTGAGAVKGAVNET
ncbi:hypothetical protein FO488_00210 [Geobacter sp. FeAm09]|uniref:hypothetical protein n=1 Tax=Geobacter sp. FeAm09 TaxID=2597769 RepID=UPI0011EE0428|nr:hypothetical protein [Geobacter sp. FeAm09]QEM66731.1 hypothetical protein FO488_00210 [Geobacter sp. FeAm09]